MEYSGEAMELDLFPAGCGGSIPTSPLQFKVIQIDKGVAASMYAAYHYLEDKGFLHSFSFGALFEGEVWGCITFGIPNAKNINGLYTDSEQSGVMEITRLVFKPESPKNSCSRMIKIALMELRKVYPLRLVITYADTAQDHTGAIYKASGFDYHGLTAQKTDFIGESGKVQKLKGVKYSELEGTWIPRSRKHLYSKTVN